MSHFRKLRKMERDVGAFGTIGFYLVVREESGVA
jgi:hypothetical protein